ncbi:MAG: hypothetical protein QNJ88_01405 [Acidimicrobiia bacterium]|nr:hypothetical protein [Acidimicrobiia bacterium]
MERVRLIRASGVVLALLAAAAIAVSLAATSYACSRPAGPDPPMSDYVGDADAVIVGTPVDVRRDGEDNVWTIAVDQVVKGSVGAKVEIRAYAGHTSCGGPAEYPIGEEAVFLLSGDHGSVVEAETLIGAFEPLPLPTSDRPIAGVMALRRGPARVVAFDDLGEVVAYGFGSGFVRDIQVCEEAGVLAEVVGGHIELRSLETMNIVSVLDPFGDLDADDRPWFWEFGCYGSGPDGFVFANGGTTHWETTIVTFDADGRAEHEFVPIEEATFDERSGVMYGVKQNGTLHRFDPATMTRRKVKEMPEDSRVWYIDVGADGTMAALLGSKSSARDLVLFDPDDVASSWREIAVPARGEISWPQALYWLDDDLVGVVRPFHGGGAALLDVFDSELAHVATIDVTWTTRAFASGGGLAQLIGDTGGSHLVWFGADGQVAGSDLEFYPRGRAEAVAVSEDVRVVAPAGIRVGWDTCGAPWDGPADACADQPFAPTVWGTEPTLDAASSGDERPGDPGTGRALPIAMLATLGLAGVLGAAALLARRHRPRT